MVWWNDAPSGHRSSYSSLDLVRTFVVSSKLTAYGAALAAIGLNFGSDPLTVQSSVFTFLPYE
jgi:hypothetical protein